MITQSSSNLLINTDTIADSAFIFILLQVMHISDPDNLMKQLNFVVLN